MSDSTDPADHVLFIFGQGGADGWACRASGCPWMNYNVHWSREAAERHHDSETGVVRPMPELPEVVEDVIIRAARDFADQFVSDPESERWEQLYSKTKDKYTDALWAWKKS